MKDYFDKEKNIFPVVCYPDPTQDFPDILPHINVDTDQDYTNIRERVISHQGRNIKIEETEFEEHHYTGSSEIIIEYREEHDWKFDGNGKTVKIEKINECLQGLHNCPELCQGTFVIFLVLKLYFLSKIDDFDIILQLRFGPWIRM